MRSAYFRHSVLLSLLVATLFVGGCDSFVDKGPISNPTKEQFYKTESDFETALNGAYDALRLGGTYGSTGGVGTVSASYWTMFEMRSDNTDQGPDKTGLAQRLFLMNQFQETPSSEIVQRVWIDTYDGIERCNIILDQIDRLSDGDFKSRVRGEALFLRSLLYYHAAVAWENVTLKTEPTRGADEAADVTSQTDGPGAVYEQITSDLETAQDLLPVSYSDGNAHRATSGAANALLGKVYLTMGQSDAAATALDRVINSGEYQLVDNYGDLWGPENENNAESIFEVQYTTSSSQGSPFTNTFAPAGTPGIQGEEENRPTSSMIDAYLDLSGERFEASMDTSFVNEDGAEVLAPHIEKYESAPIAPFQAENNWIALRYADVLLMKAEALGSSTEAWDLIDQVRDRSLPDPQYDVDRSGNFYEQLLRERRVELAFENHRWPDLKRFEQYPGLSNVAEERVSQEVSDVADNFNRLFPIPRRETDVADLDQNEGYRGGG